MAYTLSFNGKTVTIVGFFIVLPFDFDTNQLMRLSPNNAFAAVQTVAARVTKKSFPDYSSILKESNEFELKDELKKSKVKLNDFFPVRILSSQSADIGESMWILGGNQSIDCKIDVGSPISSQFPNFKKDGPPHYYWGGQLEDSDDNNFKPLKLSHAYFDLNFTEHYVTEMMAFGPSGYEKSGSMFKWIIDQGNWMVNDAGDVKRNGGDKPLRLLTLKDLRRDKTLHFFGDKEEGLAQVSVGAQGAVFLFQGVFSRLLPDEIFGIMKTTVTGEDWTEISMDPKKLRTIAQPCQRSVSDNEKGTLNDSNSQEGIMGNTVFEGICLWNLQARQFGSSFQKATPIFL